MARGGVLFGVVEHFLREGWSPGQIAGAMKMIWPDAPARRVAAEIIDTCRYALLRGAWRQERIASLRKARRARLPRARGTDRRGQLADRLSIHVRPPAGEDRALPGHWAGDFIQGAGNRSAVGVLVERRSRLVLLAQRWTMPRPPPPWWGLRVSSTASPHRCAHR
jgi:IS30 family transposase